MEKRLGIPRSSIYWILEQSGQMPPKMRRANRLVGDRQQLAHLFELLETQNKYIQELEAKLNLCEGEPDDDTE